MDIAPFFAALRKDRLSFKKSDEHRYNALLAAMKHFKKEFAKHKFTEETQRNIDYEFNDYLGRAPMDWIMRDGKYAVRSLRSSILRLSSYALEASEPQRLAHKRMRELEEFLERLAEVQEGTLLKDVKAGIVEMQKI